MFKPIEDTESPDVDPNQDQIDEANNGGNTKEAIDNLNKRCSFLLDKINALKESRVSNDHFKTEMTILMQKMKKFETGLNSVK